MLAALAAPLTAIAAEAGVELAVRPVDQPGTFFDVTMRPGETRTLEVELANVGDEALAARTYAADVYTIINGGFGARLRDEPQTGATLWLDYSTDVLELPPGRGIRRTFDVAVPADAEPGEYITSLVLENDEPTRGTGDIALDQIVRQAVAVVVTVPGPREPALATGEASHKTVADKSVVAVEVSNTGNVRLKPVAELVLRDESGAEVSRATVPMDTFYARTETLVEVPLAALLQPGGYTVDLSLVDAAENVRAAGQAMPLVVEAPPVPEGGQGTVPGLTDIARAIRDGTVPLSLVLAIAVGAVLLIVIASLVLVTWRRRRRTRTLAG